MNITSRVIPGAVSVTTSPEHHGSNGDAFTDTHSIVEAIRDPRYATSPSYRREVEIKIARSGVSQVQSANAGPVSYQTISEEQAREAPLSDEEFAHRQAMIAKATKHGH